ncbi:MAG: YqgE/AlgH family protein [Chlamydiia bacterium]
MKKGAVEIKKGTILLKSPEVAKTPFDASVYLVCEHSPNATLALRLDLPFVEGLPMGVEELEPITVRRFGGHTQKKEIFLLHTDSSAKGLEISNNLYLGGEPDIHKEIALVVGYTLWGAGKLVDEFLEGQWYIGSMDQKYLFQTPPEQLWQKAVKDLGGRFTFVSHFPKELHSN